MQFIKWKGIITKSIDDLVISAYFEVSSEIYYRLCKSINKVLYLDIELNWNVCRFNANINTEPKNYLMFVEDHWVVKLDILIEDILLIWYIIKWNITLTIW